MTTTQPTELRVFYSWQSDLPDSTNRAQIRRALADAALALSSVGASRRATVTTDEATRGLPGSPNIPTAILEKIRACDVFVADITTTNAAAPEELKRTPNPNVLFELGYAVALLGWSRIILLFNKAFGTFPDDAPFDIDRHRCSPYELGPDANAGAKKEASAHLGALLETALSAILEHNPIRPTDLHTRSPEEQRRALDVAVLTELCHQLHIPTLDRHIEEGPQRISDRIFTFWELFDSVYSSSLFHLYDNTLRALVDSLHKAWSATLSHGEYYTNSRGGNGFVFQSHAPDAAKRSLQIAGELQTLHTALREFAQFVRTEYLEIDLNSTSERAWQDHLDLMRKLDASLGSKGAS